VNWNKFGFVRASKYRTAIVGCLSAGPKVPSQISTETKLFKTHVSTVLKELVVEKIIQCLTPDLRRGRVYGLTAEGKLIAKELRR